MVNRPVFLFIGNSNMEGYASITDVSDADFTRWTGGNNVANGSMPGQAEVPGVRMWTPKAPYCAPTSYTIVSSGTDAGPPVNDYIQLSGYAYAATDIDRWVYVRSATAGQGQHRKITGVLGVTTDTATVSPAWTTYPSAGGTAELILNSHTCTSGTSASVFTKTGSTANLGSLAGKWVVMISGTALNIGLARRIASNTTTEITLEQPLLATPAAGDGFVVHDAASTVNGLSTYSSSNGSLRNLTFYYDNALFSATGYDRPNHSTLLWPSPYIYQAFGKFNCVPEATWQLRQEFDETIVGIVVGVGSTMMSPNYVGTSLASVSYSWGSDIRTMDWQPAGSSGMYEVLTNALDATNDLIVAEGDTMDVRGVFVVLGEVDSSDESRANRAKANMMLIRDSIRTYISSNSYSTLSGDRIPWIMSNVGSSSWTYQSTVNTALDEIAKDDAFSGLVDTTSYTFQVDAIHFDADSQVQLGKDFADKWREIISRDSDALVPSTERDTLATLRTKVRRRYERNGSGNDDSDTQVTAFINDSLREIGLTLGENAWFLRRSGTLTLTSVYPATITLPREVDRLMRIEATDFPGTPLPWKGITYTDQGRMQITLHSRVGGPFTGHWMIRTRDLEKDGDVALLPPQFVELLVLLTCKRLAESAGNMSVSQYYAAECERMWRWCKKDALRYDRFRQESMSPNDTYNSWTNTGYPDQLWGN